MKLINALASLALAASFASASFAASETTLIKVPKTEAAMQATRATTARDAANNPAKPAAHKTKSRQAKPAAHQTKAKQVKGMPATKHKTKAPAAR
jgi:hypothetical protein